MTELTREQIRALQREPPHLFRVQEPYLGRTVVCAEAWWNEHIVRGEFGGVGHPEMRGFEQYVGRALMLATRIYRSRGDREVLYAAAPPGLRYSPALLKVVVDYSGYPWTVKAQGTVVTAFPVNRESIEGDVLWER